MHVHVVDAILKGILMGLIMAISVGPTLFAILKYSLNFSYKAGLAFVLGVSFSDIIYVVLANVAASWLEALKPYERYVAFGGAVALLIIGAFSFFKKHIPKRPSTTPTIISGGKYVKIGISGFLINTLNPSVMLTWLGAVTLTANTPSLYRIILYATALILILGLDFSKVFLADRIKRLLTLRRIVYVQKVSAACLFFIGLALFISTVFNVQFSSGEGGELNKILGADSAKTSAPIH
jgi:threonine/homoserine/homoserine lactone efflux protein